MRQSSRSDSGDYLAYIADVLARFAGRAEPEHDKVRMRQTLVCPQTEIISRDLSKVGKEQSSVQAFSGSERCERKTGGSRRLGRVILKPLPRPLLHMGEFGWCQERGGCISDFLSLFPLVTRQLT